MADVSPEEHDGAVFAPRSVRGPSRRPPIVAAALSIAVGGLVLVGLLQPAVEPADRRAAEAPGRAAQPGTSEPATTRQSDGSQARSASTGPLLQVSVQRDGRHLFVHGEVYSNRVTVVIVSLRDADGGTTASRTLIIPGGSTAFRLGAVDRFDVQFEYPDTFGTDPITVQASGYDAAFDRLASVQVTADSTTR